MSRKMTCDKKPCRAYGLKQCPVCHNNLKSICSKVSCRTDEKKPTMILPAASTQKSAHQKSLFCDTYSDNDGSMLRSMLSYDKEDVSESEDDVSDPVMAAKWKLKITWKTLNPPVKEDQILGKWYAIIYSSKRSSMLFVGKVLRRFLDDENGPTESLEIKCLKPKAGRYLGRYSNPPS